MGNRKCYCQLSTKNNDSLSSAYVAYITAMIIHLFIISSAFQIYEVSYIDYQLEK